MDKSKKDKPQIYTIENSYIDYLRKADSRVMMNKGKRPYAGVVCFINDFSYFVPLTSLSAKKALGTEIPKNSLLFRRLDDGKRGGVNIGNMIPAPETCLQFLNFDEQPDKDAWRNEYSELLKEWKEIKKSAFIIYSICSKPNKNLKYSERKIKSHCCNFKLLEKECKKYEENLKCNKL